MPAQSDLDPSRRYPTRRDVLLATSAALLSSCGPGSQEAPKPITAPKFTPRPTEIVPTPIPELRRQVLWSQEISQNPALLTLQESNPDKTIVWPAFGITPDKQIFARRKDGTIVAWDNKGQQFWSAEERGVILHADAQNIYYLRQDNKIIKVDPKTKTQGVFADVPQAAQSLKPDQPFYRFPVFSNEKLIALPVGGGLMVYFKDGSLSVVSKAERLVDVFQDFVFTRQPEDAFPGTEHLVRSIKGGYRPLWSEIYGRPVIHPSGIFAASQRPPGGGLNLGVYSSTEKTRLDFMSIPNVSYYSTINSVAFLSQRLAIFEHKSGDNGRYEYFGMFLDAKEKQALPSSPTPYEFFDIDGNVYWSTPNKSELGILSTASAERKFWNNQDVKAVEGIGKVQIKGEAAILVKNWTTGPKKDRYKLGADDRPRIWALRESDGTQIYRKELDTGGTATENIKVVMSPDNRVFLVGTSVTELDTQTGELTRFPNTSFGAPARVVQQGEGVLYVQTDKQLFVVRT